MTRQKLSHRPRHVSPTRPRSRTMCCTPAAASSWLSESPACPAPTMTTSASEIIDADCRRGSRSAFPEHRAGQAGVAIFDAQRYGRHLPPARTYLEEVEPFQNWNAGTKQAMVRGRALDGVALDREVIDADQLHAAIHHPVRAIGGQIHEACPEGARWGP